jgi:hypothetical protein
MIFLGTITNAGTDVKNNANTAVPFTIPVGITRLFLQPVDAATLMAAVSANNATFAPAAAAMLQLGAVNSIQEIPLQWNLTQAYENAGGVTLAIRKTDAAAGNTKVFGL